MKIYITLFFIFTQLFAQIEINSFKSEFIQTIKDSSKKNISYYGKIYFRKPLKILWRYEKPIKKDIYIIGEKVVIVEPELEQVTISKYSDVNNIINILKGAQKITKNLYKAKYNDQKFLIYLDNEGNLKKIKFKDRFEKDVEILFLNPKQNIDIEDNIFEIVIDPSFDIIYN
ncbi:LolA-like outer membrane lipoprotein chaperone [Nitrosophilus labii]|uniref:LolA-like outer membrane lipoprotein chaperone n=1 Tax=Nitrosophilus labii TaxID=2706014 RepID=UPI001656C5B3|nr:LolA-like outer membrane lipoprotein chaperone [Nitrosophilus labii]